MRRRTVWRAFGIGVLAGAAYALWRAIDTSRGSSETAWETPPFPFPPRPRSEDSPSAPEPAWIEPDDGTCPTSHPVKAKLNSGIYHRPDGRSYARTHADRCYRDDAAAEADGLRAAKH